MDLKREYGLAELGMLVGVDQNTLRGWLDAELLFPSRRGKASGRGRSLYFDIRHLFVASLLKTLRRQGATLQFAGPVAKFVGRHTPAELQAAAEADLVLAYAGDAIPPRFFEQGEQVKPGSRGGFGELGFQASMRELWAIVEDGLRRADRVSAAPMN